MQQRRQFGETKNYTTGNKVVGSLKLLHNLLHQKESTGLKVPIVGI